MKADRYLFDGSHPCALRKLPCDNKDDHVKKEDIPVSYTHLTLPTILLV